MVQTRSHKKSPKASPKKHHKRSPKKSPKKLVKVGLRLSKNIAKSKSSCMDHTVKRIKRSLAYKTLPPAIKQDATKKNEICNKIVGATVPLGGVQCKSTLKQLKKSALYQSIPARKRFAKVGGKSKSEMSKKELCKVMKKHHKVLHHFRSSAKGY